MDYEKAYKEAFERAKDYHKQLIDEDNPEWAGEIEKIFPELKESEDERIKKEIIDFILDNETNEGDDINRWLAWLEKQSQVKESQISQHENQTCKENDDFLTSEDERIRKWLIGYFQQYKIDGMDVVYTSGFKADDIIAWLKKQGEKKSAWNEEDEEILMHIIQDVELLLSDEDERFEDERRQSLTWLKLLKQRMEER